MTQLPISNSLMKTALIKNNVVTDSDGPSIRSEPVSIPGRASRALDTNDGPPSPTASISGDKYILVRAPKPQFRVSQLAEADVKCAIVKTIPQTEDLKSKLCTTAPSLGQLREVLKAGSGFGKMGVYKIRIVLANQTVSAAATPSAPVYAIEPTGSSEMTTLSTLFSEFRVKPAVAFHYNLGWSGAPNQQMAAIAYDPVEGTALASVSNGLQSSQHSLIGFGPTYTSPQSVNSGGYRTAKFELLSGIVTNGSVTGLASADQWLPCNSTAGKFGYIRAYIPNGPTGVTSTLQSYMLIDVEFRNRV